MRYMGYIPAVINWCFDCKITCESANPTVAPHASAERHTFRMCGNRNSSPLCIPVPRPMEDSTPKPTHHTTNSATMRECATT
jgi:hypothetical protein